MDSGRGISAKGHVIADSSCHDEYTLYLINSSFLRAGGRDKTMHKA